jgi:hypothetical protein
MTFLHTFYNTKRFVKVWQKCLKFGNLWSGIWSLLIYLIITYYDTLSGVVDIRSDPDLFSLVHKQKKSGSDLISTTHEKVS